jgi:large subunit ribosomal protein L22
MEVRAVTKFTGISAQKARLVLDEMRGKRAEEAVALLQFMPQQSARVVAKTIKSALANATENYGYDAADMVITKIYADQAAIRRWRRFGARGRFKPWRRPSSHITVILEERVAVAPAPKADAKASSGGKGSSAPQAGSKK